MRSEDGLEELIKKTEHQSQNTHSQALLNEEENNDPQSVQNKIMFNENAIEVGCSTYCKFFFADKLNYLLLPICLIFFIASEGSVLAFLRLLADY